MESITEDMGGKLSHLSVCCAISYRKSIGPDHLSSCSDAKVAGDWCVYVVYHDAWFVLSDRYPSVVGPEPRPGICPALWVRCIPRKRFLTSHYGSMYFPRVFHNLQFSASDCVARALRCVGKMWFSKFHWRLFVGSSLHPSITPAESLMIQNCLTEAFLELVNVCKCIWALLPGYFSKLYLWLAICPD